MISASAECKASERGPRARRRRRARPRRRAAGERAGGRAAAAAREPQSPAVRFRGRRGPGRGRGVSTTGVSGQGVSATGVSHFWPLLHPHGVPRGRTLRLDALLRLICAALGRAPRDKGVEGHRNKRGGQTSIENANNEAEQDN